MLRINGKEHKRIWKRNNDGYHYHERSSESLKEGFEALAAKGLELAGEAISAIGDKAKEAAEYVVEVGSSFEAGMSEVEAISGATGSGWKHWKIRQEPWK